MQVRFAPRSWLAPQLAGPGACVGLGGGPSRPQVTYINESCLNWPDYRSEIAAELGENDMKPTRSWIVIADGAQARILENMGPGKGLTPLPAAEMRHAHPPNRDINADRPGRSHDRMGPQRHAMEPPTDAHREEKRRFAAELAAHLNAAALKHRYDRLILVAPAKTLGDLRQALGKEAAAKLDGELPKDLTNVSDHNLPGHLGEVIAI